MAERRLEVPHQRRKETQLSVRVGGHEVIPRPARRGKTYISLAWPSGVLKTVSFCQHFRFRASARGDCDTPIVTCSKCNL